RLPTPNVDPIPASPCQPRPATSYQYGMMLSLEVTVPLQATGTSPIAAWMQSRWVMHSAA
ncbi:hypothetical protein COCVIDRAFT_90993, partial [Bipolaris victoriae FI3]